MAATFRIGQRVRELATGRTGKVAAVYGKGNRRQPTATETRVMVRFGLFEAPESRDPSELELVEA